MRFRALHSAKRVAAQTCVACPSLSATCTRHLRGSLSEPFAKSLNNHQRLPPLSRDKTGVYEKDAFIVPWWIPVLFKTLLFKYK